MRPSDFTLGRFRLATPARWGLIAALAALLVGFIFILRLPPRLRIESRVLSSSTRATLPINTLGIGVDDFVMLGAREAVLGRIVGEETRALWQHNFTGATGFGTVRDVNGDGLDEICLATEDSAGSWAVILSRSNEIVARFGPLRDSTAVPPASGPCSVNPVQILADAARGPGLVCGITVMSHRPRGVALYDVATTRRRWFFPMGSWPESYDTVDLLGDGREALVIGTSSTANGLDINGTDDGHVVVLALDAEGRRIWQTVLAEEFARASVLSLAGQPGQPAKVVAAVHSHRANNPEACALVVLDGRTGGILSKREFAHSLGQLRLFDATRGVFVVGSGDGTLRMFDSGLRQLARYRAASAVEAWACADLAGDGAKSVIASTEREILILDDRLRLKSRGRMPVPPSQPFPLALAKAGLGRFRLLTVQGDAVVAEVLPIPPLLDPRRLAIVGGAALLFGVLVMVLGSAVRLGRLPSVRESRDFLVDYRQVRHDIFAEVRPFGALWNWTHEAVTDAPVPLDAFEGARDQFVTIGRGTLERFIARAREARVGRPCIERMRNELRDLEALLGEPLEGSREELSQRARRVAQAMRALSDECGVAYREVAERGLCRADRAAQDALLAQQGALVERGAAVHLDVDAGAGVPVLFDVDELREIVGQLLENAVTALDGVSNPELRVGVGLDRADGRHVILSVVDNGPGIAAEMREVVFQPGHSSRPGGGFGLGHAREVARAWGSDLVIEDPPHGRGVALRLTLPVLFPFEKGRAGTAGNDRRGSAGERPGRRA